MYLHTLAYQRVEISVQCYPKKIMYGNVLRNSDYQRNLRSYGLLNGTSCLMSSYIHGSGVRLQLLFGLNCVVRAPRSMLFPIIEGFTYDAHRW